MQVCSSLTLLSDICTMSGIPPVTFCGAALTLGVFQSYLSPVKPSVTWGLGLFDNRSCLCIVCNLRGPADAPPTKVFSGKVYLHQEISSFHTA